MTEPMQTVLDEIAAERARQHRKWREQNHPDGTGPDTRPLHGVYHDSRAKHLADLFSAITDAAALVGAVTWRDIFLEEVFEAVAEEDPARLRVELIQAAAVATQWAEAIDRRLMDDVHASRSSRYEERAAALEGEVVA